MNSTLGGAMKVMVKLIRCALLGLLSPILVMAQQAGDYRSAASGSWSETTTWEVFDGTTWGAATNVPTGSEQITVRHTVTVDVPVSVSGYLKVESGGELTIGSGSLVFGAGSVYEHARDGGSVPLAEWGEGSTVVFSGITANAPANRGQDYYHVVLNTPGLTANRDLALQGRRIRGDIQVVNTGSGRWQMVGGVSDTVWVMGDVIVEGGQFTVQGTSSPTHVVVKHYGSIRVSGGNFSKGDALTRCGLPGNRQVGMSNDERAFQIDVTGHPKHYDAWSFRFNGSPQTARDRWFFSLIVG